MSEKRRYRRFAIWFPLTIRFGKSEVWAICRDVSVGGLLVQPGDLLHADRHGVVQIPLDLAAKIPQGAAAVERQEREIIGACQAPDFTPDRLKSTWRRVRG